MENRVHACHCAVLVRSEASSKKLSSSTCRSRPMRRGNRHQEDPLRLQPGHCHCPFESDGLQRLLKQSASVICRSEANAQPLPQIVHGGSSSPRSSVTWEAVSGIGPGRRRKCFGVFAHSRGSAQNGRPLILLTDKTVLLGRVLASNVAPRISEMILHSVLSEEGASRIEHGEFSTRKTFQGPGHSRNLSEGAQSVSGIVSSTRLSSAPSEILHDLFEGRAAQCS